MFLLYGPVTAGPTFTLDDLYLTLNDMGPMSSVLAAELSN